ncbi:MAG: phosphopantetheine-binding protein, partial [Desulfobacterales bacterium]|nr:phosphopantetheine-binding protein [Desulfobacterales bacterium]
FQLKIRGHRIEPGEIEAALRELPLVSDALVTADLQNTRLVAHVVPVKGVVPTPDTLSRELQGRLPAYMIPGTFSFIDAFPLTANGKIDRKALAARNVQTNEAGSSGPQDDTEQIIMDIFKTVLQINILDRHAHFFDLGANSLHMVQVQNAIQERFGRPVSILDLFEQTSVSALARFINQTLHNAPVAEKVRDRSDLRRKARKVRARH